MTVSVLAIVFGAGLFILAWSFFNPIFFLFFIGILILFGIYSILPLSPATSVRIVSEPGQYDERDIMFARALYIEGGDAYRDYYFRFPHRKQTDDLIRSLPEMLQSGGRFYEPAVALVAAGYFEQVKAIYPFVSRRPAGTKTAQDPEKITGMVKKMTFALGAIDVGVAKVSPHLWYSHVGRGPGSYGERIFLPHHFVIVFAVPMVWEAVKKAPGMPVIAESAKRYWKSGVIAVTMAAWIRSMGYQARAHIDGNYRMILPAAGAAAGLGEIGRIGLLIHPVYGPCMRLGAVSTDMPLCVDKPVTFGVQEFCLLCTKCALNCPSGAISFGGKKVILGVEKWSTNQEACYRYWRTVGTDCGICLRVCPYSKPDNIPHRMIRAVIRRSAVARRLAVYGENLFYGKRIYRGGE
ncbi:4Fe-4S dicluster domain-containing protein [candidate division KSB1 bacterium]|nr:4Fe-4S dicluster domain-containing protein [candidate division KSB1 bacterium]